MHFSVKLYAILKFSNAIAKKSKLLFRDPLKIFKKYMPKISNGPCTPNSSKLQLIWSSLANLLCLGLKYLSHLCLFHRSLLILYIDSWKTVLFYFF